MSRRRHPETNREHELARRIARRGFRDSHPNLFRAYALYGFLCVALGLNFLFLNPTFDPLGIPKCVPGVAFLALGVAVLMSLTFRNVALLRVTLASLVAVMFFWCGALTFDFFRLGQTSLQLPITFMALGALGIPLTIEPLLNPVTSKNGGR